MTDPLIEEPSRLLAWSSVCSAMAEAAMNKGIEPPPEMVQCLRNMQGHQLPRGIALAMQPAFGRDVTEVQLHVGPLTDRLLTVAGAPACCLGHHILVARSAAANATAAGLMLLHELTHIALGPRHDVVRCWDAKLHAELSAAACDAYRPALERIIQAVGLSWSEFIQGIKNASSNMDFRHRAIHPLDTLAYVLHIAKGEGPRHGEGFNYTHPSMRLNEDENRREQDRHMARAVEELFRDKPILRIDTIELRWDTRRSGELSGFLRENVGGVSVLERGWIKSLGNALHVAQDRASHREGTEGYGHDDERIKMFGWNPDKKVHDHTILNPDHPEEARSWERCSWAAYNMALNNSLEVVYNFLLAVIRKGQLPLSVSRPYPRPVICAG